MNSAGISRYIYEFADTAVGRMPGGAMRACGETDAGFAAVHEPSRLNHPCQLRSTARAERVDALVILTAPSISHHFSQIAELALKNRLPAISPFNQFTEAGGAVAYGPDLPDLFRQLADYVDRILKGSSPGDLPIQRPTRFVLIVNLKTTKAIGLTVPQTVLLRAEVIR